MRHLLALEDLEAETLRQLLDEAQALRPNALRRSLHRPLRGRTVANLFFEPSTRTRASFQLAAERLGADVLTFEADSSSTRKGETLVDTLRNLEAMGASLFVVRHAHSNVLAALAAAAAPGNSVISAGDGQHSHPTQGLLDMLTIRQHKGEDFSRLSVAIVGDIRHSRVARSDAHALRMLGVRDLRLCGPKTLLPGDEPCFADTHMTESLDHALEGCDVVMMLRLQRERMDEGLVSSLEEYYRDWGLSPERLSLARPDAIVMHPGPMNRGVEIADSVADGPQSVILEQVSNGVAVRMAVLERLAQSSASASSSSTQ